MPNWVEKTVKGVLICTFCGSLVFQFGQSYSCTDESCTKHEDEPIRQYQITTGWHDTRMALGTAYDTHDNLINFGTNIT